MNWKHGSLCVFKVVLLKGDFPLMLALLSMFILTHLLPEVPIKSAIIYVKGRQWEKRL